MSRICGFVHISDELFAQVLGFMRSSDILLLAASSKSLASRVQWDQELAQRWPTSTTISAIARKSRVEYEASYKRHAKLLIQLQACHQRAMQTYKRGAGARKSRAAFALHTMGDEYQRVMDAAKQEQRQRQDARKSASQAREISLSNRRQSRLQDIEDRSAVRQIASVVRKYSTPNRRW